ncbi:sensor histidine kinase, partial [Streptomyces sp. SID3343]|nr:sensor histidine kinase [Streptomyces sp. SID3343]
AVVVAFVKRHPAAADTSTAFLLLMFTMGGTRVYGATTICFDIALTLPLAVRRRAPIAVFTVVSFVALWQWVLDVQVVADVALLIAFYNVARH